MPDDPAGNPSLADRSTADDGSAPIGAEATSGGDGDAVGVVKPRARAPDDRDAAGPVASPPGVGDIYGDDDALPDAGADTLGLGASPRGLERARRRALPLGVAARHARCDRARSGPGRPAVRRRRGCRRGARTRAARRVDAPLRRARSSAHRHARPHRGRPVRRQPRRRGRARRGGGRRDARRAHRARVCGRRRRGGDERRGTAHHARAPRGQHRHGRDDARRVPGRHLRHRGDERRPGDRRGCSLHRTARPLGARARRHGGAPRHVRRGPHPERFRRHAV